MMYLNAELPRHISLTVSDFNGNRSDMNFEVIRNHSLLSRSNIIPPYLTMAEPEQVSIISLHDIQVIWPKGSFYEKTPLNIEIKPRDRPKAMSPFYEISPVDIPVHSYFDILIDGQSVPESLHTKAFIARCEPEGGVINCGGKWVGNNLTTGIREMNTYAIMVDTIPPSITVLHFGPIMTGWKRMAFRISDNFRIKDRGRDLLYKAWVDGKWILMALDGKSGILIHEFDGSLSEGDHQLRLQVTDDRGNETVLEKSFTL
jgi:hypothetical protein